MGLFNALFGSKPRSAEEERKKAEQKQFDIFKYDGMRAQQMGRTDYAIKCFQEALALQEEFETMGYLAQSYLRIGRTEESRQLLKRMTEKEPTHTATLLRLAQVDYMLEEYAEMAATAQKAIDIEAGNAMAHYLLGQADNGQGNSLMCIAHLTQAIVLKEDFLDARLLRAEALLGMGQCAEAQEDVEAVLDYEPEHEEALLLRGRLLEATGHTDEAEIAYRHLIELNPFNEQAFLALGRLCIRQKKLAVAMDVLNEAIELNPHCAEAYHERGRVKLLNGDKEGATADMKKGLELNPKEVEALNGAYQNQPRQTDILGL